MKKLIILFLLIISSSCRVVITEEVIDTYTKCSASGMVTIINTDPITTDILEMGCIKK